MSRSVWIVESGQYDTRSIEAVFSTKESAEAYIARMKAIESAYNAGPTYAVDDAPSEWPLDPAPPNQ